MLAIRRLWVRGCVNSLAACCYSPVVTHLLVIQRIQWLRLERKAVINDALHLSFSFAPFPLMRMEQFQDFGICAGRVCVLWSLTSSPNPSGHWRRGRTFLQRTHEKTSTRSGSCLVKFRWEVKQQIVHSWISQLLFCLSWRMVSEFTQKMVHSFLNQSLVLCWCLP